MRCVTEDAMTEDAMMTTMNRRQFLGAAVTGGAVIGAWRSRAQDAVTPKVKIGLIGCGWYGLVDVEAAFRAGGVEVASVCDVDSDHLKAAAEKIEKLQGKRPREFKLYDEMLAAGDMQAVVIATPPHWHALQFLAALDAGLDIYCEKPLAYDIREAQAMAAAAAKKPDRVIQIGFQRRQSPAIRAVRDFIKAGGIGRVVQADVQIHYTAGILDTTPQNPPAALDWDLWCGPAPKLPYCPQIGHKAWRLEKEYGHGHLVDWGIHLIDATRWILDEKMPRAVTAVGRLVKYAGKITTPDTMSAWFDYATAPVAWRHRLWGAQEYDPDTSNGIFLHGEEGTVFVTDARWIHVPKAKNPERKVTEAKADLAQAHMADFLDAVRTRRPAACPTDEGLLSTVAVKLAMISCDTGAAAAWDASAGEAAGAAKAGMKRAYRAPWKHPHG
jgi:predicted dehydrogenase